MKFGVITKINSVGGNLAAALDIYHVREEPDAQNEYQGVYERMNIMYSLALRVPVFHVGEVLVLDDNGREIPYPGRKPSGWDVTYETFDVVDDAIQCAVMHMQIERDAS